MNEKLQALRDALANGESAKAHKAKIELGDQVSRDYPESFKGYQSVLQVAPDEVLITLRYNETRCVSDLHTTTPLRA